MKGRDFMIDRWLLMMDWMDTEHTVDIFDNKEEAEKRLNYWKKTAQDGKEYYLVHIKYEPKTD
jgi:hypothetical protein